MESVEKMNLNFHTSLDKSWRYLFNISTEVFMQRNFISTEIKSNFLDFMQRNFYFNGTEHATELFKNWTLSKPLLFLYFEGSKIYQGSFRQKVSKKRSINQKLRYGRLVFQKSQIDSKNGKKKTKLNLV